jgi:hypothetical protein
MYSAWDTIGWTSKEGYSDVDHPPTLTDTQGYMRKQNTREWWLLARRDTKGNPNSTNSKIIRILVPT